MYPQFSSHPTAIVSFSPNCTSFFPDVSWFFLTHIWTQWFKPYLRIIIRYIQLCIFYLHILTFFFPLPSCQSIPQIDRRFCTHIPREGIQQEDSLWPSWTLSKGQRKEGHEVAERSQHWGTSGWAGPLKPHTFVCPQWRTGAQKATFIRGSSSHNRLCRSIPWWADELSPQKLGR